MALRLELAGHAAYSLTAVQGLLLIGAPVASCCREVGNVAPGAETPLQRLLSDQLQLGNKLVCVCVLTPTGQVLCRDFWGSTCTAHAASWYRHFAAAW